MMRIFKHALLLGIVLFSACQGEETVESLKKQKEENIAQINDLKKKNLDLDKKIIAKDSTYGGVDTVSVTVKTIDLQDFNKTVEVHGFVESGNNLLVVPEVNGIITSIRVQEGKTVRKGDIIATIDTKILVSNRAELESQLELAQQIFDKQKSLYDQKVGSEVQYLQAKTNKESIEKSIATINSQIRKANVVAPISGKIDKIYPKRGEMAGMQQPLARIINTKSGAYIECDVSEAYYNKIATGNKVLITFPTFNNDTIEAPITYKSNFIDNGNRTFKIQVQLESKDVEYPANLFAIVSLTLESKKDRIVIPTSIIQRKGKENYIYVVEESKNKAGKVTKRAVKRPVEIELSYDNNSIIKDGLKKGDQFISSAVWSKLISIDGNGVIIK